MTRMTLIL